jgi:hypothetical protein
MLSGIGFDAPPFRVINALMDADNIHQGLTTQPKLYGRCKSIIRLMLCEFQ